MGYRRRGTRRSVGEEIPRACRCSWTDGGSGAEAAGAGLPRNGKAAPHPTLPGLGGEGRPNGNEGRRPTPPGPTHTPNAHQFIGLTWRPG
ncbi:MAG: hypothetical protein NWF12_06430 [Candidatus Bathyarchaeota archaeon]|nr:hypothetical protein [Candidatus Bathyarchaeota archaeon]